MAKPKSPLLSLGAKGTIGDTLTFQDRGPATIARKKPIPTNPRSLAQMYQRWLYEDYCYLWRQQSLATRQLYATAGSRFHLTGFQYWMKVQLSLLPDIAGWWKMDDNRGAITRDSSRNRNNAIVVGASPIPGAIDQCFYFDGINDYLQAAHSNPLNITEEITIECLIEPFPMAGAPTIRTLISKGTYNISYFFGIGIAPNRLEGRINNAAAAIYLIPFDSNWHHAAFVYQPGIGSRVYYDGDPGALVFFAPNIASTPQPLWIGDDRVPTVGRNFTGPIDNVIIYNRALDATEILRHSERRYPL